jgi:ribosomal protein S18 acetylase RimI-like enzyme
MWVAELPGIGIIGQLFVQLTSARQELADGVERAYIYGFRIKPDFRGFGLGRRMMQVAENDLAQRRFQRATLNVARDNPQARRLYETLGYRVVGMDPGQWSYLDHLGIRREVHEPAWRMEKHIGEA